MGYLSLLAHEAAAAVTCYLPGAYEMCIFSRIFARLEGRLASFPSPLPQQKPKKKKIHAF